MKVNHDISIVRGTSNAFGLAIKNADGSPFELAPGQVFIFAVKKKPKDIDRVLVKKITNTVDDGSFYLELTPPDTADLEPGKYFYDVGLQHGSTVFYNVIEASVFEVKPNISKLGDGA